MKNNIDKYYLISFGDSDKYFLHDNRVGLDSRLTKIETELNRYLQERFPDDSFAYFTSPRVDEISEDNAPLYSAYPPLDDKAMSDIKKVLAAEVENMEANDKLDRNAPYSKINPGAFGVRF